MRIHRLAWTPRVHRRRRVHEQVDCQVLSSRKTFITSRSSRVDVQSTCRRSSPRVLRKSSNRRPPSTLERRSPEEPASTFRECRSRRSAPDSPGVSSPRSTRPRGVQSDQHDRACRPDHAFAGSPRACVGVLPDRHLRVLAPLPPAVSGRGRAGRPIAASPHGSTCPSRIPERRSSTRTPAPWGPPRPSERVRLHRMQRRRQPVGRARTARVRRVARHGHRRDRRTDRTTGEPPRRRGGNPRRRCRGRLGAHAAAGFTTWNRRDHRLLGDEVLGSEHRNPASTAYHPTLARQRPPAFGEHRRERHAQRRLPHPATPAARRAAARRTNSRREVIDLARIGRPIWLNESPIAVSVPGGSAARPALPWFESYRRQPGRAPRACIVIPAGPPVGIDR